MNSWKGYSGLKGTFRHTILDHKNGEFVKTGGAHTNTVEGFFSHLKRTIGGTHIHVSRRHLLKYASEVSFRYVHREEGQLMFNSIINRIAA